MVGRVTSDQGNGMKWRVMVELTGCDGTVRLHEVSTGGSNTADVALQLILQHPNFIKSSR